MHRFRNGYNVKTYFIACNCAQYAGTRCFVSAFKHLYNLCAATLSSWYVHYETICVPFSASIWCMFHAPEHIAWTAHFLICPTGYMFSLDDPTAWMNLLQYTYALCIVLISVVAVKWCKVQISCPNINGAYVHTPISYVHYFYSTVLYLPKVELLLL